MGFKSQLAVESNLWALQSQMKMAEKQQVNAVFAQVLSRLMANLNASCLATDIYGRRCRLESETAKDLTATWLTADPEDTGALLIRAAALRSLGEMDAAKEHALRVKQMATPARALGSVLLAQCLYLEGHAQEARDEIEVATKLAQGTQFEEPAVVAALMSLAEGKVDASRDSLQKAIRTDRSTEYAPALLAMVDCMRTVNKSAPKSVTQFISSRKKQSARNNLVLMETEAFIYAHQHDVSAATAVAKEMLSLAPESQRSRYEEMVKACESQSLKFAWSEYVKAHWLLP